MGALDLHRQAFQRLLVVHADEYGVASGTHILGDDETVVIRYDHLAGLPVAGRIIAL